MDRQVPPRPVRVAKKHKGFTSDLAKRMWEDRHAQGGPFNERLVHEDGTIAPHAYTIDPDTGCHVWNYSLTSKNNRPNGYQGVPQAGGRRSVRRVIWETAGKGPLPRHVGVSCGNARCINPDHFVAENLAQQRRRAMREAIAAGEDATEIAARHGVQRSTVYHVARQMGVALPRRRTSPLNAARRAALTERPAGVTDRDWAVYEVYRDHTGGVAGDAFRLSRQRVDQIADKVIAIANGARVARVRVTKEPRKPKDRREAARKAWQTKRARRAEEVIGTPDEGYLEGGL